MTNNLNITKFGASFFTLLSNGMGVLGAFEGAIDNVINATASLGNVTGGLGAQLMALASMHPVITAIIGITAVIGGAALAIGHFTESLSEAQDKAAKSKGNYDNITSEIESMNSELDSTRQRIAEINSQENISITDAEELGKLQEQNEYLQQQIELKKSLQELALNTAIDDALNAVNKKSEKREITYDSAYGGEEIVAESMDRFEAVERAIQTINEKQARLNELKEEQLALDKNSATFESDYESYDKGIGNVQAAIDEEKEYISSTMSELGTEMSIMIDESGNAVNKVAESTVQRYQDLCNDVTTLTDGSGAQLQSSIEKIMSRPMFAPISGKFKEAVKKGSDSLKNVIIDSLYSDDMKNQLNDAIRLVDEYNKALDDNAKAQSGDKSFDYTKTYAKVVDISKQIGDASTYLGMDFNTFVDTFSNVDSIFDLNSIIGNTTKLSTSLSDAGVSAKDLYHYLSNLYNGNELNFDSVRKSLKDLYNWSDIEKKNGFKAAEYGQLDWNNYFDNLNEDDLQAVFTIYLQQDTSGWTLEDFKKSIEQTKEDIESAPITFSSLLSDDAEGNQSALSKQVDDFQSNITSIQSAIDSLKAGENVDLTDLIQQFPELEGQTDNLQQSLSNISADKLKTFVSDYRDTISGLTDEGEITKAESFLQRLINSVDLSGMDISSMRDKISETIWSGITDGDSINRSKSIMDAFKEELMTDDGTEILYKLSLDPESAYWTLEEWQTNYAKYASNAMSSIDSLKASLSSAITYQDNLNAAMASSVSATGLTIEQVETLTDAYKDLDGFDADKLFERTASGIHLNTNELRKLNAEYGSNNATDYLQAIADKEAELQAARDQGLDTTGLESQLLTLKQLASQYDGLTSAYQRWLDAQSNGEEGDTFRSVSETMNKRGKELYKEGRYNTNEFRAIADYYSDQDLTSASMEEVVAAYEESARVRDKYFTGTKEGIDNFMRDMQAASEKNGFDWVETTEDGRMKFNADAKEIADYFGTSTESIQDLLKAASEYTDSIVLGDTGTLEADRYIEQVENAQAKIKELQESGSISGSINANFNIEEMSLGDIKSKIDELKGERIEIDTETNPEAAETLDDLISKTEQEYYFKLNTETNGGLDTAVSAVNQIQEIIAQSQNEAPISISAVVNGNEQIQALAEEIASLPPEVQTTVGIEAENVGNVEGILGQLSSNPESITVPVNYTKGEEPETVSDAKGIANFDLGKSPTTVPDATGTANFRLGSYPTSLPTITQTVVRNITEQKAGAASGTAHAQGTAGIGLWNNYRASIGAYAQGNDWALPHGEDALVNEIGTESIVRDGRWFPIPGGAHLEQLKKGDIIFSADQTKELVRTGRVISGGGHGRVAHADGTAYNTLRGYASLGAYDKGTWTFGNTGNGNLTGGSTSSTSSASQTKSTDKSTKKVKSSLEKILESFEKLYDWIVVKTERLQQKIDLKEAMSENAVGYQNKNSYLSSAQKTTASLISANEKGAKEYQKQADKVAKKVGLSSSLKKKVDNGTIKIEELSEDNKKRVEAYKEWYDKAQDCKQAVEELKASQRDLAQQKLDNITDQYDAMLSHIEHQANMINGFIDQAEMKGYVQSTKYYDALIKNASAQKADLVAERNALTASLKDSMDSGIIQKGSVEWYNMQSQINDVTEAIQEADTSILKFGDSIRQIQWDVFDMAQDKISRVADEAGFLIDLMSDADMFSDEGHITDQGLATMGLHGVNYNTYMEQADKYKAEMLRINKELADDPNNTKLIERREELLDLQHESILAAEDEKQAIADLIKDGIEKELDSLQDLIDKYKDALDSQKDLADYQKNISDQTSEIAKLRKRLAAYSGDDSEEGRLNAQKTQNELKEAEEKLQESEYDKFISDQEKLLDSFYDEYEEALNSRLDNIDQLISDTVASINENASKISDVLNKEASEVGATLTTEMQSIWGGNGAVTSVLSTYSQNFTTTMTTVHGTIGSILENVKKLAENADRQAGMDVTASSGGSTSGSTSGGSPSSGSSGSGASSSSNGSSNAIGFATTKTSASSLVSSTVQKLLASVSGDSTLDLIKKKINSYKKASYSGKNHSDLFKYIHQKSGRVIDESGMLYIGQQLGVSGLPKKASDLTTANKNAILKKLKAAGYASGTRHADEEWAWTQEHYRPEVVITNEGSLLSPRKDGGVLTRVNNGAVFNGNATDTLYDFANNPQAFLYDKLNLPVVNIPDVSMINKPSNSNSPIKQDVHIEFNLPNVYNYEDFMNKMQNDAKFDELMQSSTIGLLNGKSQFSKRQIRW